MAFQNISISFRNCKFMHAVFLNNAFQVKQRNSNRFSQFDKLMHFQYVLVTQKQKTKRKFLTTF